MKYTRKQIEVDAIKYTGTNEKEISDFTGGKSEVPKGFAYLLIPDRQGNQVLNVNDWVTKGENGELRVVTHDDFKEEYELINS